MEGEKIGRELESENIGVEERRKASRPEQAIVVVGPNKDAVLEIPTKYLALFAEMALLRDRGKAEASKRANISVVVSHRELFLDTTPMTP